MSDMNNFKKKLFDTIGTVADKTRDIAAKTTDKAKDIKQIAKLSLEVSNQKDEIRDAYYEIGKLYYAAHHDDAEEDFAFLCNGITEAMQAIEEKTQEINDLKSRIAADDYEDGSIEVDFEEVDFEDTISASEGCSGNCACCNEDDICVTIKTESEEVPANEDTPVEVEISVEETPAAEAPAEEEAPATDDDHVEE